MVDVLSIAGLVVGSVGLVVGSVALLEAPYLEKLKKPELEIEPVPWQPRGPLYPMTFASARVINTPLPGSLTKFLSRDAAEACEITIDFFTWGDEASRRKVFDSIKGRWDSHDQPLKFTPLTFPSSETIGFPGNYAGGTVPTASASAVPENYAGGTVPTSHLGGSYSSSTVSWRAEYDPSLDSPQQDISVGSDRGQISVAILKDGNAFAFANESYGIPPPNHLCKPEWKLTLGETYRVEIHIEGSNVDYEKAFKLEYLSNDFSDFKLKDA